MAAVFPLYVRLGALERDLATARSNRANLLAELAKAEKKRWPNASLINYYNTQIRLVNETIQTLEEQIRVVNETIRDVVEKQRAQIGSPQ